MTAATTKWRAIGTTVEIAVVDDRDLRAATAILEASIAEVDAACSRFRADSELALLPDDGEPHAISPVLADLVAVALRAAQVSDGLVDPTLAPALERLGYDRDFAEARKRRSGRCLPFTTPGPGAVRLDRQRGTLALAPGTRLDLGATAKARLADLAAATIIRAGVRGTLVSCGGDITAAGEAPEGGWRVRISDDCAGGPGPVVTLHGGGLATSSTTVRRWKAGSTDVHHIIDPRTGLPTEGPFRTITVAAATCVDANIATTAAFVHAAAAPAWLRAQGLPARLVTNDGDVLVVAGWPDETQGAA